MKIDDFEKMINNGVNGMNGLKIMLIPALPAVVDLDDGKAHVLVWYEEDQGREGVTLFDLKVERYEPNPEDSL